LAVFTPVAARLISDLFLASGTSQVVHGSTLLIIIESDLACDFKPSSFVIVLYVSAVLTVVDHFQ
jgi:hypothetical protein